MNKFIIILTFIIFSFTVNAQNVYYVAPSGGNDNNAGTNISEPWATWQHAFETADAGDTVFFRGGVWYPTSGVNYNPNTSHGNSGEYGNWIVYTNYPGEKPILDCQYFPESSSATSGFNVENVTYVKFRGLTIRHVLQTTEGQYIAAAGWTNTGVIYLENMTSTGNGGAGMRINTYDTLYLKNCDSYNNCDTTTTSEITGGRADGYTIGSGGAETDTFKIAYIDGCRAWMNSDDGIDIGSTKQMQVTNCWSWNNGRLQGDGVGIKVSYSNVLDVRKRVIRNCITAYNYQKEGGFSGGIIEVNLYDEYFGPVYSYFNNSSYNDYVGISGGDALMDCATEPAQLVVRNNMVYAPRNPDDYFANFKACDYSQGDPSYVTESNNTFDLTGIYGNCFESADFTVTDADFISLDTVPLRGDRKADGSLPTVDFMKLAPTSDLIDGGIDVGLDYYGDAPDLGAWEYSPGPQIIADHTIIDDFDYIPQYYIDEVKKMQLGYIGESHAAGFRTALTLLEADDATYQAEVGWFPASQTSSYLRAFGAFWGDVDNASGWQYGLGEEDWYWNSTGISRIKAGLTYINETNGTPITAFGFGWCWDPDEVASDMDDYVDATKEYIDYCVAEEYSTKVFFSTGPVDGSNASGETGYNKYLAYEAIRDSVDADTTRILFDFADILCYDDDSETPNTVTWGSYTYPVITTTNLGDESIGHIGEVGAIRLAKAMWWMLARIAGWDGNVTVYSEDEEPGPSTATDILTLTLASQTGAATINATTHTVAIEVAYTADITNLTPAITLSYGATVSPTSGTAGNFTTPQTYTVTAQDETTTQEWVVTVTQAEEPEPDPSTSSSLIMVLNGKQLKL